MSYLSILNRGIGILTVQKEERLFSRSGWWRFTNMCPYMFMCNSLLIQMQMCIKYVKCKTKNNNKTKKTKQRESSVVKKKNTFG